MDNIFDIRFSFEQRVKDEVIYKFSNKQGGAYNVFAYHWQCFAWAAVIGFLRNEKRPLTSPIADRPFSLKTMQNNNGEKVAQALICMAIAKTGSLDIMKEPAKAIDLINEYANGGFYHIKKLMDNGENSFNDLEKVKQEIFSRDYNGADFMQNEEIEDEIMIVEDSAPEVEPTISASSPTKKKVIRWSISQDRDLIGYFKHGMTISQLSALFNTTEECVEERLRIKKLI